MTRHDVEPVEPTRVGPDDVIVGQNLRDLRRRSGLTQKQLAISMRLQGRDHWRQNTVSRIESGRQRLLVGDLDALSRVAPGDVLRGTTADDGQLRRSAVEVATREKLLDLQRQLTDMEKTVDDILYAWGEGTEAPTAREVSRRK